MPCSPSWSGAAAVLTKVMLTAYTPTQIIPLRMGLAYLTLWAPAAQDHEAPLEG